LSFLAKEMEKYQGYIPSKKADFYRHPNLLKEIIMLGKILNFIIREI
jgi:hypothetical protein